MINSVAVCTFTVHCFLSVEGMYLFEEGKILSKPFAIFDGPFDPKQCLKECLLRKRCNAVGYSRHQLQCRLGSSEDTWDHPDKGYMVGGSSSLKQYQSVAGICADHNCTIGQKCEKTGHSTKCIISDCEVPPTLPGCTPSNLLSTVGINVLYAPNPGYEIVGTNGIRCKANGKWTSPNLTCRKKCLSTYWKQEEETNYLCFKIYYLLSTYNESYTQCENDGGHLVRLDSEWKVDKVKPYLVTDQKHYIDGKITPDDVWIYSDGTEFMRNVTRSYDTLSPGYNVALKNGRFVAAYSEFQMNFICEM